MPLEQQTRSQPGADREPRGGFKGAEYNAKLDRKRLSAQVERIRLYMLGVEWRTVAEISDWLELHYRPAIFPETSVSAQLRNLRKAPFNCVVQRRLRTGGKSSAALYEYRVLPPAAIEPQGDLFGAGRSSLKS